MAFWNFQYDEDSEASNMRGPEFTRFENPMKKVVAVPHSEIKRKIEEHRKDRIGSTWRIFGPQPHIECGAVLSNAAHLQGKPRMQNVRGVFIRSQTNGQCSDRRSIEPVDRSSHRRTQSVPKTLPRGVRVPQYGHLTLATIQREFHLVKGHPEDLIWQRYERPVRIHCRRCELDRHLQDHSGNRNTRRHQSPHPEASCRRYLHPRAQRSGPRCLFNNEFPYFDHVFVFLCHDCGEPVRVVEPVQ